jgi:hypothetical protein
MYLIHTVVLIQNGECSDRGVCSLAKTPFYWNRCVESRTVNVIHLFDLPIFGLFCSATEVRKHEDGMLDSLLVMEETN